MSDNSSESLPAIFWQREAADSIKQSRVTKEDLERYEKECQALQGQRSNLFNTIDDLRYQLAVYRKALIAAHDAEWPEGKPPWQVIEWVTTTVQSEMKKYEDNKEKVPCPNKTIF